MARTAGTNQYGRMVMTGDYRSPNPNIKFIKVADPTNLALKYPNHGDCTRLKVTSYELDIKKTTEYVTVLIIVNILILLV